MSTTQTARRTIEHKAFPPTRIALAKPEDTRALGRAIGQRLRPGDLVLLSGDLGAGKTVLTKGIAAGMGVTGIVMSPTFVIARIHHPRAGGRTTPLIHVDAYRLGRSVELDDLDLETDLTTAAVVVEWGEGIAEGLADERLVIELDRFPDDTRQATILPVGGDWPERCAAMLADFRPGESHG